MVDSRKRMCYTGVTIQATNGGGKLTKIKELRSLIYGKFDSEAECAELMGWPRQRLSKITHGQKVPNIDELNSLAKALQKPVGDIAEIFLRHKSPNGQQKGKAS